jgi:hypothetical protein
MARWWQRIAVGYALLGTLAAAIAVALRNGSPFAHPSPWLALDLPTREGASLLLGVAFAAFVVATTRIAVARFAWARRLHNDLRPVARSLSPAGIVVLAVASSLGEELLFRGLLAPLVGVVPQAIVFGLLHQMRGASRWVWIAWATAVGLSLGAMFALTGSLAGPLAAHALVNGYNLAFLRAHDPDDGRRRVGGLYA